MKEGLDAKAESEDARLRDENAWAILISRLADVLIEPSAALAEDRIGSAPELGFFRSRNEAMVYRIGLDGALQVLIVQFVRDAIDEGQLVSEAVRRKALSDA